MRPRYLEVLDDLPTMVSGKVDRKSLPPPSCLFLGQDRKVILPQTAAEKAVVASWERLFHMAPISIDDNFFIDLHGHSLIAGKIVTDLRSAFSSTQISVRDIYSFPTVRLLALHLEEAGVQFTDGEALVGESPPDVAPVTSLQPPLPRSRWLCAALQLVALIVFYGVVSAPVVFVV